MKHIFTLIDGTGRSARSEVLHSNVYRLNVSLKERTYNRRTENYDDQVVFYYPGIGAAITKDSIRSKLFGYGLEDMIKDAYVNIASNYFRGDKLYLFGFSRGGMAARILAGFISNCGLLRASKVHFLEMAWQYYKHVSREKGRALDFRAFSRKNFDIDPGDACFHNGVTIRFMGLFDSVPGGFNPADSVQRKFGIETIEPANCVAVAVHILAIDENRRLFSPLIWMSEDSGENLVKEKMFVEQIWMPGVHTDIGGGFENGFLGDLSLLTMIEKIKEYCPDIKFYNGYIAGIAERMSVVRAVEINGGRGVSYSNVQKLIPGLLDRRPIRRVGNTVQDSYYDGDFGIFNSIHPFVAPLLGAHAIVNGRGARYRPANLGHLKMDQALMTYFPDGTSVGQLLPNTTERSRTARAAK